MTPFSVEGECSIKVGYDPLFLWKKSTELSWAMTPLPRGETLARVTANLRVLKHAKWDSLTNPRFWFSQHRCWPTYNTVTGLSASGSPSISLLRVSLGNCLINPQVQGLLSIHLISGRLFYKVVSALLYCSTVCFFWLGGWFFLHFHSIYKRILHCNDSGQLTGGKRQTVSAWAERLMVEKVLFSSLGNSKRVQ